MTTFAEIDAAAAALYPNGLLCSEINHLVAHADDNAESDEGKMRSLESLLSYEDRADVRFWFTSRGVTF